MKAKSMSGGRLAMLAAAVGLAVALVALPTAAFAATKAATRIVVAKTMTVENDTPGQDAWPVTLTAKLQKKSGSRYVALSGTVKLYWSYDGKSYELEDSGKGSSVSFDVYAHGKLKFVYSGSSKTKSCAAYTVVYETIGDTVSTPDISIEPIAGTTKSMVTVRYDINWNTDAYDGPIIAAYIGYFQNGNGDDGDYTSYIEQYREIDEPGTVEFNYKVENVDILSTLHTDGGPFVPDAYDPYVVTPAEVVFDYTVPAG